MPADKKKTFSFTLLFSSYMFLQLTVLRFCNNAGDASLPVNVQEKVYYVLQIFFIAGAAAFVFLSRILADTSWKKTFIIAVLAVLAAAAGFLLAGTHSDLYLAAAFIAALCLGAICTAVYEKMARAAEAGERVGIVMGFSCAFSIALQYAFQLAGKSKVILGILMAAAFVLLFAGLFRSHSMAGAAAAEKNSEMPLNRRLLFISLITVALLLFCIYYNEYIHHLQIRSEYTEYNAYSWPRLMLVPCYLLFGFLGDYKNGKYHPIAALSVGLLALLTPVLAGNGAVNFSMCLYYCALAAAVSYYDLNFWRIACRTKLPALWAVFGRVLDSVVVLIGAVLGLSLLAPAVVLMIYIFLLAAAIFLMALNGDLSFSAQTSAVDLTEAQPDPEKRIALIAQSYGLTPKEAQVFRELVLTEDKQESIGQRLSIKLSTVQYHTTSIYRKTGASTRSGLSEIYYNFKP